MSTISTNTTQGIPLCELYSAHTLNVISAEPRDFGPQVRKYLHEPSSGSYDPATGELSVEGVWLWKHCQRLLRTEGKEHTYEDGSIIETIGQIVTETLKDLANRNNPSIVDAHDGVWYIGDDTVQAVTLKASRQVNEYLSKTWSEKTSVADSEVDSVYEEKKKKGGMTATVQELGPDDVSDDDTVYREKMEAQTQSTTTTQSPSQWLWGLFSCGTARK